MHPRSRILLLGWQGTLRPAGHRPSANDREREANLLRPWLDDAIQRLQNQAVSESRIVGSRHRPIEPLSPLPSSLPSSLHDRLMGIAAAASLAKSSDPPLQVDPAQALRQPPYSTHAENAVHHWATATAIFLNRLQTDRERLASWIGKSSLPVIETLSAANSDIHDSAGSTIKIEFSEGRPLFYKPRPMTGERLWYQLTQLTANVNPECAVTAARVLIEPETLPNRYGWMEALHPIGPDRPLSQADRQSYWRSAGSLLCHAWVAGMTDLHMANMVATPTGPAVVDAECLATPEPESTPEADPVIRLATQLAATGLLPSSTSPSISGLFGRGQTVTDLHLPVWTFSGCKLPTLSLSPAELLDQENRCGEGPPIACVPAIADGFLKAAQALIEVRDQLLQRRGWLDRLAAQHAPRVILRDTLDYGLSVTNVLLSTAGFPANLHPASPPANSISAIANAEELAIQRLHIPRFFIPAASRHLASTPDGIVAQDFSKMPVSQALRLRIEALSLAELREKIAPALLLLLL